MEEKALRGPAFSGSHLPEPGFLSCPPAPRHCLPVLFRGRRRGAWGNAPTALKPPTQGRPQRAPHLLPCLGQVSKHSL